MRWLFWIGSMIAFIAACVCLFVDDIQNVMLYILASLVFLLVGEVYVLRQEVDCLLAEERFISRERKYKEDDTPHIIDFGR